MANIKPYSEYPPALYGQFYGFASGDNAYKLGKEYAIKLGNAELTEDDKVISARGYEHLGSDTYFSNRIREIMQYRNDALDVLLCFGSNSGGTSGGVACVSAQWTSALVFNEVLVLTDVSVEPVMLQVGKLAYLFNGTDNKCWDGNTSNNWYSIGATKPTSAPVFGSNIAGSLTTSATYVVGYCWYDSTNKRRSNTSTLTSMTAGGGGSEGIRATFGDTTAPGGYDKKIILCTNAFGTQLYEDQIVDAATTSVDITQSDQVRKVNYLYEGNNDQPTLDPNIAVFANGKIYGGRTDDSKCRVIRSKVSSQHGAMPQSFPPVHFSDCDPSESDKLVGLGVVGSQENQTVIVVKQKTFGKLVKVNEDIEVYQKIADIGGHGQKSVFTLGTYCGFFTESDIIVTDGVGFKRIAGGPDGKAISEYLQSLDQTNKTRVYAKNVTRDKQIRISTIPSGQTQPKQLLLGHYGKFETEGIVKWTTREQGPNTSTYPGVQASCIVEVLDDNNRQRVLYGNSASNGKIYEADVGTNDDGSAIYQEWIFHPENFGDFRDEKIFSDIIAKIRAGDSSTQISILYQKNLRETKTAHSTKTLSGAGFAFGSGQFGITAFTNSPINTVVIPFQVRARELALILRLSTLDKQMELLDYVMTGMG